MKTFRFRSNDRSNAAPAPAENQPTMNLWSVILPIVFDLVCGVLLILLGGQALKVTAYVLAGVMIVLAAWLMITYFRSSPLEKLTQARLACGLALLVTGILLVFHPGVLEDYLPSVWGLALLFGSFLKIQYAFDEKALNIEKWWIMLILAGFSLIIGILALTNPAFLGDSANLIIGIMLIVEAVLDIVVFFVISRALKAAGIYPAHAAAGAEQPAAAAPQPAAAPAAAPAAPPAQAAPEAEEPKAE